jgi:hypothetical protein
MSLLATSSPYQSSPLIDSSKKKIPTIRKTIKKPHFVSETNTSTSSETMIDTEPMTSSISPSMKHTETMHSYHAPTTFLPSDTEQSNTRYNKVSSLLEQMTNIQVENDGQHLATFQPLELPELTKYHSEQNPSMEETSTLKPILKPPKTSTHFTPLRTPGLSEYQTSYEIPTFSTHPSSSEPSSQQERLWDRIGYIIHLLEQQKNERTDMVLEEYVLYILLGIFMIFICDSFAKSGRYIRT